MFNPYVNNAKKYPYMMDEPMNGWGEGVSGEAQLEDVNPPSAYGSFIKNPNKQQKSTSVHNRFATNRMTDATSQSRKPKPVVVDTAGGLNSLEDSIGVIGNSYGKPLQQQTAA